MPYLDEDGFEHLGEDPKTPAVDWQAIYDKADKSPQQGGLEFVQALITNQRSQPPAWFIEKAMDAKYAYRHDFASRLKNLPPDLSTQALQNIHESLTTPDAFVGKPDLLVQQVEAHPNFKPRDPADVALKNIGKFWYDYEDKVRPEHFATMAHLLRKPQQQSLLEYNQGALDDLLEKNPKMKSLWGSFSPQAYDPSKPVQLVDHRGQQGSSAQHVHLLSYFHDYARAVQGALMSDIAADTPKATSNSFRYDDMGRGWTPVQHSGGSEPHVLLYRGVAGDYGKKLLEAHEKKGRSGLTINTAPVQSWTADYHVAEGFARRSISGQPVDGGAVLARWTPIKDIVHSGWHDAFPQQKHRHLDEHEFVVKHPDGQVRLGHHGVVARAAPFVPVKPDPYVLTPPYPQEAKIGKTNSYHRIIAEGPKSRPMKKSVDAVELPPEALFVVRQARYAHEGDDEAAALAAVGMSITEENRKALRAVTSLLNKKDKHAVLVKSEKAPSPYLNVQTVTAMHPDGEAFAQALRNAYKAKEVQELKLGGRHTRGSVLAHDPESGLLLFVKSSFGPQNPAKGEADDPSTQAQREAAFYAASKVFGLDQFCPECHLIDLDGEQVAVLKYLSPNLGWETLDDIRQDDPNAPKHILAPYRDDGLIHMWGAMDFILGQVDRHANNLLVNDGQIRLIDEGSAFAGRHFDPAHDKAAFIPCYLRFNADSSLKFNELSAEEKIKRMETAPHTVRHQLGVWLDAIPQDELCEALVAYGINPGPALERLEMLRNGGEVDEVVIRAWATL